MKSSWLEQCEVSRSIGTQLQNGEGTSDSDGEPKAMHIFLPNCPLSSFVGEPIESSINLQVNILIHPIMYDFLSHVREMWIERTTDGHDDDDDDDDDGGECMPSDGVTLGPLPMEPYHSLDFICPETQQQALWCHSKLPIHDLSSHSTTNVEVSVSCLVLDPKLDEHRQTVGDDNFTLLLQGHLLGRLVKAGSVVLLATRYDFAVLEVLSVSIDGKDSSEVYRIPEGKDSWQLVVDIPQCLDPPRVLADKKAIWESTIPGYEELRDQLVNLGSLHGSPHAPSAVLLTGVSGVGKSRLASSLAHLLTLSRNQTDAVVYYLSVRDLIFHAAGQSDLFEDFLSPRLVCASLWILDDLHLLEREDSHDEASQNDVGYISTCEALLRGIDRFKSSCYIVGICRDADRLPWSFTKSGRLEKHIGMMPPTQLQRSCIWDEILLKEMPIKETRQEWSRTLVAMSLGCVAADLHRIYRDAYARRQSRSPQDEVRPVIDWSDLRDAARRCVPSQLAELDVVNPHYFDPKLSWREIHAASWQSFIGYEDLKKGVFRQVIVPWKQFLARSEGEAAAGGQSWPTPPSGVLFHGRSGCGKTEAVKCMASSLELSMIQVRASDILDKWLGGSEALIRSLFARARAAAPCILFIDEIDAIACNRTEDESNDSGARILSTLLNEMDGVTTGLKMSQILVVACTNRLRALDTALLRPGRLQEHFELFSPTLDDLRSMLHHYLRKVPLHRDVSIEAIASALATRKATGAEVEGTCRELCLSAFRSTGNLQNFRLSGTEIAQALRLNI